MRKLIYYIIALLPLGLFPSVASAYPELINLNEDTLRAYFHSEGSESAQNEFFEYVIRPDESMEDIAANVQTSLSSIATLNNYPRSYQYSPRSSIIIPRNSGIYIRENPNSDLHYKLWERLESRVAESIVVSIKPSYQLQLERFYFFDGETFTEEEEALFLSSNEFDAPLLDFIISSNFGNRISPISGNPQFHYGIDLAAREGGPVFASADGIIQETGFSSSFGYFLFIVHDNGLRTLYAHILESLYSKGQSVKKGTQIAYLGSTGYSTGAHLHYEVHVDGSPVDPINYLPIPQEKPVSTESEDTAIQPEAELESDPETEAEAEGEGEAEAEAVITQPEVETETDTEEAPSQSE